MTTAMLDRVPVDQISERAGKIRFARALAGGIGLVFMAIGWCAAMTLPLAWKGAKWCYAAAEYGWASAQAPSARAQNKMLRAQVEELTKAVERLGGP